MTLALNRPMTIKPEDFEPPLKREEAAVPGYWTIEELAKELGVSTRYVHYLIKGNTKLRMKARLTAYKAGSSYLVADADVFNYIWSIRQSNQ